MNKDIFLNALAGLIYALLIVGIATAIKVDAEHEQWLKQGIKKYPDCATARNADVCIKLKTLAEEE